MFSRSIRPQETPSFFMPYSTKFERVVSVQVAENGVLKNASKIEVCDPAEDDKEITYTDFNLQNILDMDNPKLLNPVQMVENKLDGISNLQNFNKDVQAVREKAEGSSN